MNAEFTGRAISTARAPTLFLLLVSGKAGREGNSECYNQSVHKKQYSVVLRRKEELFGKHCANNVIFLGQTAWFLHGKHCVHFHKVNWIKLLSNPFYTHCRLGLHCKVSPALLVLLTSPRKCMKAKLVTWWIAFGWRFTAGARLTSISRKPLRVHAVVKRFCPDKSGISQDKASIHRARITEWFPPDWKW